MSRTHRCYGGKAGAHWIVSKQNGGDGDATVGDMSDVIVKTRKANESGNAVVIVDATFFNHHRAALGSLPVAASVVVIGHPHHIMHVKLSEEERVRCVTVCKPLKPVDLFRAVVRLNAATKRIKDGEKDAGKKTLGVSTSAVASRAIS